MNLKTLASSTGIRINQLLEKHKMTRYKLGKESGLNDSTLRYLIYGGTKDVWLSSIAKVAKVFGMTLEEFFADRVFDLNNIDFD